MGSNEIKFPIKLNFLFLCNLISKKQTNYTNSVLRGVGMTSLVHNFVPSLNYMNYFLIWKFFIAQSGNKRVHTLNVKLHSVYQTDGVFLVFYEKHSSIRKNPYQYTEKY